MKSSAKSDEDRRIQPSILFVTTMRKTLQLSFHRGFTDGFTHLDEERKKQRKVPALAHSQSFTRKGFDLFPLDARTWHRGGGNHAFAKVQ